MPTRREFVQAAGLAAIGVPAGFSAIAQAQDPRRAAPADAPKPAAARSAGGPAVIASPNGLRAAVRAMELIKTGANPLDAVIAGVNIIEDDPEDTSVGLGGLPNEDGVVELDASVMYGPTHRAGAVAALQNIRNPSSVARLVMQRTDHVLIVGEGALRFARAHGFKEENLLTDKTRRIWLKWKEGHSGNDKWLRPPATRPSTQPVDWDEDDGTASRQKAGPGAFPAEGPEFTYGTVNCCALTAGGDLAGCTSTSGLSYKIPGRVGDSPIIGAGLYVDNEVGAAGSTGRGEANLQNCSSFLVVELMRAGRTPEEACLEALRRIAAHCEQRLRNAAGEPGFPLKLYALRKDGLVGGASMRGPFQMAYHNGTEAKLVPLPGLYGA